MVHSPPLAVAETSLSLLPYDDVPSESQADSDIVSPGEGERIKPPPTPKAHASFDAAYCPVACLLADAGLDAAVTTERSEDISLMAVSSSS